MNYSQQHVKEVAETISEPWFLRSNETKKEPVPQNRLQNW
jgi:hypothetical protein